MTDRLSELIELGDSNAMLREIDLRSDQEDWDGLAELSARCRRAAEERGKPLWGAAAYGQYRLALDGPPECLEQVMEADLGRFGLGPIPEVAASSHNWDEVKLPPTLSPAWEAFIYECIARGDRPWLNDAARKYLVQHHELPLTLTEWEPEYSAAEYHPDRVDAPRDPVDSVAVSEMQPGVGDLVDDAEAVTALVDLVRIWQSESNGDVAVVAASGNVEFAIRNVDTDARSLHRISPQSAIAEMAWAGASGGAHGRRAGMAAGRRKAWWAITALAGQHDDWPLSPGQIGQLSRELQWYTWDVERTREGWTFALAVVDELDDAAFAIYARDHRNDEPVV